LENNEFDAAILAVEEKYDAHVYIYSAAIDSEGYGMLVQAVTQRKAAPGKRRNGLLILNTAGGLPNSAYKIARLMQQTYDKFLLFTPRYCKSAGTLIALGAHTIIMDDFSELGPLDVQLFDKDEINGRKSGLLSRSAFEALSRETFDIFSSTMINIKRASGNLISFKLAADISWRMTAEVMSPIFGQLNPDIIGSDHRDLSVAIAYGERLEKRYQNPKPDTVQHLVTNYPSHDFIIDRDEALTLFERVEHPCVKLYRFTSILSDVTYNQATPGVIAACIAKETTGSEGHDGSQNEIETSNDIPTSTDAPLAGVRDGNRSRNKRK